MALYPHHKTTYLGCGLLALILLIGIGSLIAWVISVDRAAGQYPNARPVSSQSSYHPASSMLLWDDAYRTGDSLNDVYDWYRTRLKVKLDLASHTMKDGCLFLYGSRQQLGIERRTTVKLCETPAGQTIFISRSTSIN